MPFTAVTMYETCPGEHGEQHFFLVSEISVEGSLVWWEGIDC